MISWNRILGIVYATFQCMQKSDYSVILKCDCYCCYLSEITETVHFSPSLSGLITMNLSVWQQCLFKCRCC